MIIAAVHCKGVQRRARLFALANEVGTPQLCVANALPERPPRAIEKQDRPRGAARREVRSHGAREARVQLRGTLDRIPLTATILPHVDLPHLGKLSEEALAPGTANERRHGNTVVRVERVAPEGNRVVRVGNRLVDKRQEMPEVVHSRTAELEPIPNVHRQPRREALTHGTGRALNNSLDRWHEGLAIDKLVQPPEPAHS
mmetsp:Transcript_57713/g.158575  ORF Transcript_57713/g.158575 Transcript_57713/m.158575 type:complete len:200 (+) Transcript_57713:1519-2118(+)